MWKMIRKALIELFWPIFKDVMKKYSRELIEWLMTKLKNWLTSRNATNAKTAESKAEACEAAAMTAASPEEAEKHEAIAKVWREVAEMFRQENEALSAELQHFRAQAQSENNEAVEALSFENVIVEKDGKLESANYQRLLPK